ncbi:MAG: UDP-N-acetylglucosamine 1-carboxyvinyltransferase [Candidatus Kapaibacteriales bacterium]
MDKLIVEGKKKLNGKLKVSGAKNGAIAMIPACLLASGTATLSNVPNLRDVWTMSRLMTELGAFCELNDNQLFIDTRNVNSFEAPYEHVKKMRASFYVLGPLLARFGQAKVSLPGGCAWGPRPVDLHLKGMEKLGAEIDVKNGYVYAKADNLKGGKFHFEISSVGATGNVMMAAVKAKGTTQLTNAAIEPEITALARFLCKIGAKIDGIGTSTITIEGVDELKLVDETVIPDRIEAATYLIAAAMSRGTLELTGANPYHMTSVIAKLEESGAELDINPERILLKMDSPPNPVNVTTAVYPGFPTDVQAQWIAYMTQAEGMSRVKDTIYTDRFKHVPELGRLGANIEIDTNSAAVTGPTPLTGAEVMSADLRASAALVLAALVADGRTDISRIYHLDRGYENLEEKLKALGADIKRQSDSEEEDSEG